MDTMKGSVLFWTGLLFLCVAGNSQTTISFSIEQDSLLTANAGDNSSVRAGTDLTIGSNPTANGGTEPYQFEWMKGDSLISRQANPAVHVDSDVIYSLMLTDSKGCTSLDSIQITLDVTGYDSFSEDGIKVYPNPAKDWFTIETDGKACTVTLIGPDGSVHWTKSLTGTGSFKVPDVPGTYLIKLQYGQEVRVSKIIFE